MSAISIETKKVTELSSLTTPGDSHVIPIHDGTGLKKITFANFKAKAVDGHGSQGLLLCFSITQGRTMRSIGESPSAVPLPRRSIPLFLRVHSMICTSVTTGLSVV